MTIPDVAALDAAAARLIRAQDAGAPCLPVRDVLGDNDVDAAYAVQQRRLGSVTVRGVGQSHG
jgi:2-keto-4-pentenoate hydratase